jgi:hypothetical protein
MQRILLLRIDRIYVRAVANEEPKGLGWLSGFVERSAAGGYMIGPSAGVDIGAVRKEGRNKGRVSAFGGEMERSDSCTVGAVDLRVVGEEEIEERDFGGRRIIYQVQWLFSLLRSQYYGQLIRVRELYVYDRIVEGCPARVIRMVNVSPMR